MPHKEEYTTVTAYGHDHSQLIRACIPLRFRDLRSSSDWKSNLIVTGVECGVRAGSRYVTLFEKGLYGEAASSKPRPRKKDAESGLSARENPRNSRGRA